MSATIHSFDLLMALYHQKLSLFDDIQKLKQIAKQARWSSIPDFHHIIVFKEQAIVVRTPNDEVIFTSSNMDRYTMKLITILSMQKSNKLVHHIEIYNRNFDWLDQGFQLQDANK